MNEAVPKCNSLGTAMIYQPREIDMAEVVTLVSISVLHDGRVSVSQFTEQDYTRFEHGPIAMFDVNAARAEDMHNDDASGIDPSYPVYTRLERHAIHVSEHRQTVHTVSKLREWHL